MLQTFIHNFIYNNIPHIFNNISNNFPCISNMFLIIIEISESGIIPQRLPIFNAKQIEIKYKGKIKFYLLFFSHANK